MSARVLMIYPRIPYTFWNFDSVLRYYGKRASFPPLGLLTIASLIPSSYEVLLVDMNVRDLSEEDLMWADIVFISSMTIQQQSFNAVVDLCYRWKKIIVAGGPHIWYGYDIGVLPLEKIDHLFFNEAEATLPEFISEYERGIAKKIYMSEIKPDITFLPAPRYDLIDLQDYWALPVQFSRGCPFNCEFCEIIEMNGRRVRTKKIEQIINELEIIYKTGFQGYVFFVDDNFIGNKKRTKELLAKLSEWQKKVGYPFNFYTQASINMARDDKLLDLMSNAGFTRVFVGIETTDENTLNDIQKNQNTRDDLLENVRKIQAKGIIVMAGFIFGFDTDTEEVFDRQLEFIRNAGIPAASVGLLMAMPNTQLFKRLSKDNRIIGNGAHVGDNVSLCLNYVPKMPEKTLIEGYKRVLSELYEPRNFYHRILVLLENLPKETSSIKPRLYKKDAPLFERWLYMKSTIVLFMNEIFSSHGLDYLLFINKARKVNPSRYIECVSYAALGRHFFSMAKKIRNTEYVYQ